MVLTCRVFVALREKLNNTWINNYEYFVSAYSTTPDSETLTREEVCLTSSARVFLMIRVLLQLHRSTTSRNQYDVYAKESKCKQWYCICCYSRYKCQFVQHYIVHRFIAVRQLQAAWSLGSKHALTSQGQVVVKPH